MENIKKNKKIKYYEQKNLQLNISKANKILKWSPKLSINESIKITVDWYKNALIDEKSYSQITEKQILDYIKK